MVKRIGSVLALAALVAGCAAPHGRPGAVGGPVPKWTLPSVDGNKISSASFKGKPLYINFFATWCPPCVAEAPDINALAKEYAPQGLQVVGVDELESTEKARSFVQRFGLSYPAAVDDGTLQDAFLLNGLPVHIFIARNGIIQKIHRGEMSKADIEASIRAIL